MNTIVQVGWVPHPSVIAGLAAWTLGYMWLTGPRRRRMRWGAAPSTAQQISFHAGSLIVLLALISPLDPLGDEYLFSAHMVQHLLLLFVAAPCWLMGVPDWLPEAVLGERLARTARGVTRPVTAAAIFGGVTVAWHHPAIYEMAQQHELLHVFEHLTYLGAGMVGWWPIVGPNTKLMPKPTVPVRLLYGFALALPCTLLGALFTFAGHPIYPSYVNVPRAFGLEALDDQRLGGLLMWIPTHMIVLLMLGRMAAGWLSADGGNRTYAHGHPPR